MADGAKEAKITEIKKALKLINGLFSTDEDFEEYQFEVRRSLGQWETLDEADKRNFALRVIYDGRLLDQEE